MHRAANDPRRGFGDFGPSHAGREISWHDMRYLKQLRKRGDYETLYSVTAT